MIGLPTETDDDLEELAVLAEDLVAAGRRAAAARSRSRSRSGASCPRRGRPFQWQPYVRHRRAAAPHPSPQGPLPPDQGRPSDLVGPERRGFLEALLSRGGRELSATIERAHDLGAVFDGWNDHLDLDAWRRPLDETGIDLDRELGERDLDADPAVGRHRRRRPQGLPQGGMAARRPRDRDRGLQVGALLPLRHPRRRRGHQARLSAPCR
jgi:hypothetical protein